MLGRFLSARNWMCSHHIKYSSFFSEALPLLVIANRLDVHEFVHRDTTMKITNKMRYI
jgi:hypothetical protein